MVFKAVVEIRYDAIRILPRFFTERVDEGEIIGSKWTTRRGSSHASPGPTQSDRFFPAT